MTKTLLQLLQKNMKFVKLKQTHTINAIGVRGKIDVFANKDSKTFKSLNYKRALFCRTLFLFIISAFSFSLILSW